MSLIALACSLPVALIGAYYLVNACAVAWMGGFEGRRINRMRVRLRRANGLVMLLMGLALYLGVARVFGRDDGQDIGPVAPLAWIATMPLLVLMLVLAWLDMRLTRKLKQDLVRKAIMKDVNQSSNDRSDSARSGAALAFLGAALLCAMPFGCDNSSAQAPSHQSGQRAPATRPATNPTTMRAHDAPRPREGEPQQLRTVQMQLGNETFVLQVADVDEERMYGLMFRKSLAPDEGMIFIYPEEDWLNFWMKNTFIPLDIAFVSEDGMVLNIAQMVPHDLEGADSAGLAKYAIELPVNAARRAGLKAGMTLKIPDDARDAKDAAD